MARKVEVPDYTEALVGYRLWKLKYVTTAKALRDWRWLLLSPVAGENRRLQWKPGKAMRASCLARKDGNYRRHHAPGPECRCGIYACKTQNLTGFFTLFPMMDVMVVGEVALWGRVVVCERGFRAQYAYPTRLSMFAPPWSDAKPDERLQGMYDALLDYRVPVDFSELVVDFRPIPSPLLRRRADGDRCRSSRRRPW
jgi:hypothetical protein